MAEAILDRLVHNAYTTLKGGEMGRKSSISDKRVRPCAGSGACRIRSIQRNVQEGALLRETISTLAMRVA
jgi:hypothetical protein